ncbi:glycosyltransferase family 4 protein [Glycomyces buryatensis]|nr:glycosyltransferase [Glycomyces buryatensis]
MAEDRAQMKRVVMVVANGIEGDSRVQKSARSLAEQGLEVHLLGVTTGNRTEEYQHGDVHVLRLPIPKLPPPKRWADHAKHMRYPLAYHSWAEVTLAERRKRLGWIDVEALRYGRRMRVRRTRGVRTGPTSALAAQARGKLERSWLDLRTRQTAAALKFGRVPHPLISRLELWTRRTLTGARSWRAIDHVNRRFELALRGAILRLEPDVIHAHDIRPLGIAARVKIHLEREGKPVKIVYDAHEYIPGCDNFPPDQLAALSDYEREHIGFADEVVTVSPAIAEMLEREYDLERRPTVVLNAANRSCGDQDDADLEFPDVRAACGLDSETPLAVYCGGANPERNLEVIIEALTDLPEVHMAFIVNSLTSPYMKSLIELGDESGLADRLHLMTYVPYEVLPRFMSTADVGIHPMRTGILNHEVALPNKYFEYMHARLPLVVSDLPAMAAEIAELGHGEVFDPSEPASLAAALRKVISDKQAYQSAYRNPAVLDDRSWERQVERYCELYERLGCRPRHGAAVRLAQVEQRHAVDVARGIRGTIDCPDDVPLLAVYGELENEDALGTAVAALEKLPTGRLMTIHSIDGAEYPGLDERIRPVTRDGDPRELLAAADVGIVGTSVPEGQVPPAVYRFVQARTPVVVARSEAVERLFSHYRVGELYTADDPGSLAMAVEKALAGSYELAAAAADFRLGSATPWPPTGHREVRLGMGTANFAGQLSSFARALCQARPEVGVEIVTEGDARGYPADVRVDRATMFTESHQLEQVQRVASYTHLLIDAFRPAFGRLNGHDFGADLPMLRNMGMTTALLSHGSEVRRPREHLERHEWSAFRHAPDDLFQKLVTITGHNGEVARESGCPIYVTTPDLLDDLPEAVWAPLVVDVDFWQCSSPVMERAVPVVLHAPSRRWTKGTQEAMPVLSDLHERGVIEFRMLENVPHSRMREHIAAADIVIDQIGIGSYGTLGCEAMAAGRPVIAYIGETSAERYGPELPIVNATPPTLAEALFSLLEDRDRAREIGRASTRYARVVHDGRLTAAVLGRFLDGER